MGWTVSSGAGNGSQAETVLNTSEEQAHPSHSKRNPCARACILQCLSSTLQMCRIHPSFINAARPDCGSPDMPLLPRSAKMIPESEGFWLLPSGHAWIGILVPDVCVCVPACSHACFGDARVPLGSSVVALCPCAHKLFRLLALDVMINA